MKKIHYLSAVLSMGALVVEALPTGAVLCFADGPDSRIIQTFSCFSLTPFGYGNFGPLITGVLTCLILALSLVGLLGKRSFVMPIRVLAGLAAAASVMSLMFGPDYYNTGSFLITVMLTGVLAVTFRPDLFDCCTGC